MNQFQAEKRGLLFGRFGGRKQTPDLEPKSGVCSDGVLGWFWGRKQPPDLLRARVSSLIEFNCMGLCSAELPQYRRLLQLKYRRASSSVAHRSINCLGHIHLPWCISCGHAKPQAPWPYTTCSSLMEAYTHQVPWPYKQSLM